MPTRNSFDVLAPKTLFVHTFTEWLFAGLFARQARRGDLDGARCCRLTCRRSRYRPISVWFGRELVVDRAPLPWLLSRPCDADPVSEPSGTV